MLKTSVYLYRKWFNIEMTQEVLLKQLQHAFSLLYAYVDNIFKDNLRVDTLCRTDNSFEKTIIIV